MVGLLSVAACSVGPVPQPPRAVVVVAADAPFAEQLAAREVVRYVWLRAGVRRVWIIDPTTRVVFVWRPDLSGTMLSEDDELSGEDVIPGFRRRVGEMFPKRPYSTESAIAGGLA